MNFNLLEEGFIPVLWSDGKVGRVGIRRALAEAGGIRQIAASNPMDNVALLRFLLAVLYWCQGPPPSQGEKDKILAGAGFPPGWFGKLDQQKDCFNLLGEGKRFYQDKTAKRCRPTTELLQELPTGNNFRHFRRSDNPRDGLCPACCALGLMRLPLFSVSGLPDLKAGINGTPPIYVIPLGETLLGTLCLNWTRRESLGSPTWECSQEHTAPDAAIPLLAGLTALARRVWLHEPTEPGPCSGCGSQQQSLIRTCEFQSAGAKQSKSWDDPHVVYVQKANSTGDVERRSMTAPDLTKSSFRLDRPWATLMAALLSSDKHRCVSGTTRLMVVGFATDQAKNIDVWERICTLPPCASGQSSDPAGEAITIWNEQGRKIPWRMKPKNSESDGSQFVSAVASIRPHVEARVSSNLADLLSQPEKAWPKAVDEYRQILPAVAGSLAPGFTVKATRRRGEIARALPDMTPKAHAEPKKPKTKKGATK